ncbi:MAG: alpha/beta hydrolase [Pseudomonadota bacterium]|nr:alpha/beta hydrolase [Pseudomonadota bacterium]MEE3101770.1 alpha/beta hydrolase [Pseudomonadota bacterium]
MSSQFGAPDVGATTADAGPASPPLPEDAPPPGTAGGLRDRLAARARRLEAPGGIPGAVWRDWAAPEGATGKPVLMLHGGSGSWTHWLANIGPLNETRRVIAVDLPGAGESPDLEPPQTVATIAWILRKGMAALVPDGAYDIVAFSFGTSSGAELAMAEPADRVGRLVLVGPARFGSGTSIRDQLESWRRAPDPEARAAAHRNNLAALMLRDDRLIDDDLVAMQAANAEAFRLRIRAMEDLYGADEVLAPGRGRTRLGGIWGEHDAIAAPMAENREIMAGLDPAAPVEMIPGVGHWVMYEAAGRFNRKLIEMLDEA